MDAVCEIIPELWGNASETGLVQDFLFFFLSLFFYTFSFDIFWCFDQNHT